MARGRTDERINEIRTVHVALQEKIGGHPDFFEDGNKLLERLDGIKKNYEQPGIIDDVVQYFVKILENLYHIEGDRDDFRNYFRTNVIGHNPKEHQIDAKVLEQLEQQNKYLEIWYEFARSTGILQDDPEKGLHPKTHVKDRIGELTNLHGYAQYGQQSMSDINEQRLTNMTNNAFTHLIELVEELKAYALPFHAQEHGCNGGK